jgi:uncharacterized cupin superfamily protein
MAENKGYKQTEVGIIPEDWDVKKVGGIRHFRKGETGAHRLYNYMTEPCVYLDIRTFIGYDVCEYPDSNKIFLVPSYGIFDKDAQLNYFDGEENVQDKWK